jgi:hypothetical protein
VLLAAAPAWAQELDDLLLALEVVVLDGREPPALGLPALDGSRVSLEDFRGRVVLLYFWQSG